jgi:hypothetical protein
MKASKYKIHEKGEIGANKKRGLTLVFLPEIAFVVSKRR